jgi:hypothetical protein
LADRVLIGHDQGRTRVQALFIEEIGNMVARVRQFVAPPIPEDQGDAYVASLLNTILLTILVTTVVGTAIVMVLEPSELVFNLIFGVVMAALILGLRALAQPGQRAPDGKDGPRTQRPGSQPVRRRGTISGVTNVWFSWNKRA